MPKTKPKIKTTTITPIQQAQSKDLASTSAPTQTEPPKLPFRLEYNKENDRWDLPANYSEHLAGLYGVNHHALAYNLFMDMIHATPNYKPDGQLGLSPNAANAFMMEMQPGNPVESLLLTQMLTIHQHTMKTGQRLTHADKIPLIEGYTRQMNQLARTFTTQVDALHKLRNGGKQTVQVLHQHVQAEPGSQVMVGQQAKA